MSKTRTAYFCQNCGNQSPKWIGKCSACGEWNTYVEEVVQKTANGAKKSLVNKPQLISELQTEALPRIALIDQELNRVLGGGL